MGAALAAATLLQLDFSSYGHINCCYLEDVYEVEGAIMHTTSRSALRLDEALRVSFDHVAAA